jgi:tetratricopeptide (TPR) repeat protein
MRTGTSMLRAGCVMFLVSCASFLAQGQPTKASIDSIESLIRSREYGHALQVAQSALEETPNDFRIWTLEGIVLSIQSNNQDALHAFDKALSLSPNYPAALKGEVQLLYQAQDKQAIPLLERILKADPKDETAHEMLAVLEERQGNCDAAKGHFLKSAEVISTHPGSLEAYGNCLVHAGEPQKAVPIFERLAALLPQRTYPKYDLAVVLVETRQDAVAIRVLDPLLTTDPPDPDVLSLASDAYEAVGDTAKAVALLRHAIVLSPEAANYYTSFAAICLNHESFQVGIDMINAGLRRISGDPSLYISRGLLYAQLAQYDQAEADFKTAENLDAAQSVSSYAIDLAELQKNNTDNALSQIRSQLKLHPDSALLHYLLAKLLSSQGTGNDSTVSEEALQSALLAVNLKPDMVEARDLLASIYTSSGQYNLAIDQCRLALQSNSSDQTAIYHLIVALRHSGPGERRGEIQSLVKRLSELQTASRQQETDRKRFKIVEQEPVPPA